MIILMRTYLLAGLIGHKLLWQVLKRRGSAEASPARRELSLGTRFVKLVKLSILLGIVAQTVVPDEWVVAWISPKLFISTNPDVLRLAGVATYTLGLIVAILGRVQLGNNWSDIETAKVLTKQSVVSHGVYRFIRHPIYVGDLILLVGLELALNSWLLIGVVALMPIVLSQAVREEKMLAETLDGYDKYCADTKRFIPFVV